MTEEFILNYFVLKTTLIIDNNNEGLSKHIHIIFIYNQRKTASTYVIIEKSNKLTSDLNHILQINLNFYMN